MTDGSAFPQWFLDAACPDAAFDAAYAGLTGERRAWIKKTAAQLFEMSGAGARRASCVRTCWTQGFQSVSRSDLLDGILLLLDPDCRSAARVAAAALPAVISGAPAAAACLGGDPAPDVLAALELCGLETVAMLESGDVSRLAEHIIAQGTPEPRLAVLALGFGPACEEAAAMAFATPGVRVWTPWTFPAPVSGPSAAPDMGIWAGDGASWDLDLVAWAQSGHHAAVWNAPGELIRDGLPQGITTEEGGFEAFLSAGYRALLVSESLAEEAGNSADLVLGPGQEGCWAWPDLTPDFFLLRRLRLGGGA